MESQYKGLVSYATTIKEAVEQNDKNSSVISNLRNTITGLQHSHIQVNSGTGNTDETCRLLSERVVESCADLQQRVGELLYEADEINIDAIRANKLNSRR